jgi:cellulose 1,4-beta-cellobiosidase
VVYRGTSSSSQAPYAKTTTTSFADSAVALSTMYYYRVAAYDPSGNFSLQSAVVSAAPLPDTTPPTTPTGVKAQALSISTVSLSWSPSTDDTKVTSYQIYRRTSTSSSLQIGGVASTTTAFTDSVGAPSTTYYYTVSARDIAGNTSTLSAAVTATTLADTIAPSMPANLSAVAAPPRTNLSWSASTDNYKVSFYNLYRGTSTANMQIIASPLSTSYSDARATAGVKYYYAVAAQDTSGNISKRSVPVSLIMP